MNFNNRRWVFRLKEFVKLGGIVKERGGVEREMRNLRDVRKGEEKEGGEEEREE